MPHTPKAFAATCALTLSLALSAVATHVPAADADTSGARSSGTTAAVPAAADAPKPPNGYSVRLTTFNILTGSIAAGGVDRATRAAHWVQDQGADVAAFQEVAKDQLRQLQTVMPRYSFFPRRGLGTRGSAIQIAWNSKTTKRIDSGYIMHPFLGWARPIPYILARDLETGRTFWVVAIHNAPGGQEHDRDVATAAEIALIKKILSGRGRPVFVMGDVNERSEFCDRVAGATPLISMNGGSQKNPCPVPRFGGPDWMLGAGAEFSHFEKVYNGISDHPALTAAAWVPSAR